MTDQALKLSIHELINKTDDPEVLQSIYLLLLKLLSADDDIVGFEADGTPISKDDFIVSVLEGEEDIKNGRVVTLKSLRTEQRTQ